MIRDPLAERSLDDLKSEGAVSDEELDQAVFDPDGGFDVIEHGGWQRAGFSGCKLKRATYGECRERATWLVHSESVEPACRPDRAPSRPAPHSRDSEVSAARREGHGRDLLGPALTVSHIGQKPTVVPRRIDPSARPLPPLEE